MALRILVYTGLLYQGLIKTREVQRGEKLPAVFPLALYNGRERWHAARDVGDLIERLPGRLKRSHPAHRYFLLEEGAVSEDRRPIRETPLPVSFASKPAPFPQTFGARYCN